MLKKTFNQPCLVIAKLLAHYVLKIGNNWLYKRLPGMPETSIYLFLALGMGSHVCDFNGFTSAADSNVHILLNTCTI